MRPYRVDRAAVFHVPGPTRATVADRPTPQASPPAPRLRRGRQEASRSRVAGTQVKEPAVPVEARLRDPLGPFCNRAREPVASPLHRCSGGCAGAGLTQTGGRTAVLSGREGRRDRAVFRQPDRLGCIMPNAAGGGKLQSIASPTAHVWSAPQWVWELPHGAQGCQATPRAGTNLRPRAQNGRRKAAKKRRLVGTCIVGSLRGSW
jgi:hypothetical protein